MCVNYHGSNQFIIKKWYPLPLISRLLDQPTLLEFLIFLSRHFGQKKTRFGQVSKKPLSHFEHVHSDLAMYFLTRPR